MNKKGQVHYDNLITLVFFLVIVSAVGIFGGLVYFGMNTLEVTLKTVDFVIPTEDNTTAVALNMSTFQDILGVVVYPFLGLRDSLPYLTYFLVFSFIIALGFSAYLTSKNPIFFVLHLLFTILITYFSFLLSNMYIGLLADPFINALMINFTIYNKLMIYLPQIIFFVSLVFGAIAFINIMKPQNKYSSTDINY